jgi:hypothetical protein
VGAIRWDPWYETVATGGTEINYVASALSPSAFQGRAPACATATNGYTISLSACGTQTQIDSEITAAHNAGLDYWAYVWYGPTSPLNNAWALHQSSAIASQMNWCFLFGSSAQFVSLMGSAAATYATYCKQANYQKVLTTRPLVYILHDFATSSGTIATAVGQLQAACSTAGAGVPYIVIQAYASSGILSATGCQAIGEYALAAAQDQLGGTYAQLVTRAEAYWATMLATAQAVVPTCVTGWDRRPRAARPVPWEATGATGQKPYIGYGSYYQAGAASAIATHVSNGLTWLTTNAANSAAQTLLIYSWDEHDEGGSTLNPTLGGGSTILNAVAAVL